MLLSDLLTPDRVVVPMMARDKAAAIAELTQVLVARCGGVYEVVLHAVMEREQALTTGVGYGVAIPHGRCSAVTELSAVCGIARDPVPYGAIDGEPVRLFFLIVGPEASAGQHVKILSHIARLLRRDAVREGLMQCRTPDEFHHTLLTVEER